MDVQEKHGSVQSSQKTNEATQLSLMAPRLYLGSAFDLSQALRQQPQRFSHILSCADSPENIPEKVQHLRVNIEPNPMGESHSEFQSAVEFIAQALAEGGEIAVHCEMGTSRSPAVVAAYLIYAEKVELIHAVKHVYESRHGVQINPWVLNDLKRWADQLN